MLILVTLIPEFIFAFRFLYKVLIVVPLYCCRLDKCHFVNFWCGARNHFIRGFLYFDAHQLQLLIKRDIIYIYIPFGYLT